MNKGWVKLHRQVMTNDIFRHDRTAWHIFQVLLLVCDKKTGKWSGGRFQLADLCNENPATTYKALKRLEKAKMVTLSSNNKYTTIYICKWKDFQDSGNTIGNNKVTTGEQLGNTLTRIENKELRTNTREQVPSVVSKLYYEYLKKYSIPVTNHKTLQSKIKEMEKLYGIEWCVRYLNYMINEYEKVDIKYKPVIMESLDLYRKSKSVEDKLKKQLAKQEVI
jgi:hypothetical protein